MSKIPVDGLLAIFQRMYAEHWDYVWGAAREGCVDCSGAFVYAYRQYGKSIYHGSNSIARTDYVVELLPISRAETGMAAFKCRPWRDSDTGNKWYGKAPGNIHHIGLVDADPRYVLNAKGQKSGFSRDKLSGYTYVARLSAVQYSGGGGGSGMTVIIKGGDSKYPIRLRARPSTSSDIVAKIPQGAEAELLESLGTWSHINYGGTEGYVLSEFVHNPEEPAGDTVTVSRKELEAIYNTIGGWLNLRG